jgi:hypothetical protein
MSGPRLTAEESGLVQMGAHGHPMALINLAVLEGPAPSLDDVRARVATLLHRFPRYEAVPVAVPFELQRPVWARPANFDLSHHVTAAHLDPPGGDGELLELLGTLASRPFAPGRPLWELCVIDGVADGRWVLATRTHLAVIDGLRNDDLHTAVLLPERSDDRGRPVPASPGSLRLMGDAMRDLATSPYEQVRTASSVFRRLTRPRSRGLPPVGELGYGRLRLALADLKAVRSTHGGSVNDVLVTLVAAGIRAAGPAGREDAEDGDGHAGAGAGAGVGATSPGTGLRTAIPFAVRSLSRPGHYDNQIAVDQVDLPLGPARSKPRATGNGTASAAVQHYKAVSAELDRYARDNMAVGGKLLTRMNGIAPSLLLALGARACVRQRADLAFVNAPGPPAPIAPFGRPMVDAWALAPHPPSVRWSATARSYADSVSVSLTGTAVAGVEQAMVGMQRELQELLAAPAAESRRSAKAGGGAGTKRRARKG